MSWILMNDFAVAGPSRPGGWSELPILSRRFPPHLDSSLGSLTVTPNRHHERIPSKLAANCIGPGTSGRDGPFLIGF